MDNIKQGSLGDCYFLTEISAPSLVKEKFRTVKYNLPQGIAVDQKSKGTEDTDYNTIMNTF